ncbi:hypothetical protein JCM10212_003829 [Sporobolomyces blumeae]
MLSCTCTRTRLASVAHRSLATSTASHHDPSSSRRPRPFNLAASSSSPSSTTHDPASWDRRDSQGNPTYDGKVEINLFQRALLAVGSGVMGLVDTSRHDMVAVLSETTSGPFLTRLRTVMRSTPSGREILRDRPRITERSINLDRLAELRRGTFGREYYEWLKRNKVTPDTRDPVRYISDPELAYLMQRYRESHDFYHVLLGFGVSLPAELVVKWFELANFNLPVAFLSSVFGPLRMDRGARARLWDTYGGWALRAGGKAECLISVYWEKEWETDIDELRARYGVERPPVGFKKWRDEERRIKAVEEQQRAAM